MPHFVLEYTDNIYERSNVKPFLKTIHKILIEDKEFRLDQIKSRSIEHNQYYISNGDDKEAFVYLTLSILQGKSAKQKHEIGQKMLVSLEEYFNKSIRNLNCRIIFEIREIIAENYYYIPY